MKIHPGSLEGAPIIETTPHVEARGVFARWYCVSELSELVGLRQIVQINYSRTTAVGAIRGLHFQHPPHMETKFVRCLRGRVADVVVDLRANSPSFLRWQMIELTPGNAKMVVVPEGCAHGFQTIEPDSELLYLHTAAYAPQAEGGVRFDDPRLSVDWPLPITDVSSATAASPC